MPGKHGPNRFGNYADVHERWMAEFLNEGFVTEDSTAFTVRESVVLLAGTIV